ncbi:MAG: hypothetical protein ABIR98_00835 [Usitatibacter sp.]
MRHALVLATLALSGCATTYQLSVMPRDSGKMYTGTATEHANGQAALSIAIEGRTYTGTWVTTVPERTHGFVVGGFGFGRRGMGLGTVVSIDNPAGGEAKALLSASDGSGLRCDFRSGRGTGGGVCKDDRGKEYDVQLRQAPRG